MTNSYLPDGYTSVTPYLVVKDAARALAYYHQAFDAKVMLRLEEPSGRVGHAEMKIGNAIIMLADEFPPLAVSPETVGGSGVSLYIYVEDVDSFTEKAIAEGLEVLKPVADQFYGDRTGHFKDPFGHLWAFGTHIEDLTPEEIGERAKAAHAG